MELSPHRTNGNDPFNLWQKHTDEEVPNAGPVPRGGPLDALSPPTAAAGQTAWFIDCCFTLVLIHCSVCRDRRGGQRLAQPYKDTGWYRQPWKHDGWVGVAVMMETGWLSLRAGGPQCEFWLLIVMIQWQDLECVQIQFNGFGRYWKLKRTTI